MRRGVWAAAVLAAGGCGAASGPVAVAPVTGAVVYADKPAAGVAVFFLPTTAPGVPKVPMNPHAVTGPDGTFRVSTYGDGDGAAAGEYRVILLWPDPTKAEAESPPDKLFGWYDASHTKLTAVVKDGGAALPPFKLPAVTGPPPPSEGVPGRN